MEQTTDRGGIARFDLASVSDVRGAPASATVSFGDSSQVQVNVSVGDSPAYAGWRKREQDAPHEKAEREQQQAAAKYARELKSLEEVEQALPQIKGKWDAAKASLFEKLVQNVRSISGDSFSPSEKARLTAAATRVASFVDTYKALVRAAEAERDAQAVTLGRRAVLGALQSPSTAKFVNDAVFASCGNGIVTTVHEVDAQNGFGAMIRARQCALVDVNSGAGIPAACGGMAGILSIAQPSAEMCGNFRAFIARGSTSCFGLSAASRTKDSAIRCRSQLLAARLVMGERQLDRGPSRRAPVARYLFSRAVASAALSSSAPLALQETNQVARAVVFLFLFRHHLVFGTRDRLSPPELAPIG